MNHVPEGCLPASAPGFTPKQGQYLAFIHAYTLVIGRLLRGNQDARTASIWMRKCRRMRDGRRA